VCGGLARATGTDPVLFRVVLAVLALFGGAGLVLYLLAWLLLPSDGDEVSPGEALLGRGRSGTSPAVAVLLAVAILAGLTILANNAALNVLPVAALVTGIVLLMRRHTDGAPPATAGAAGYGWPGAAPHVASAAVPAAASASGEVTVTLPVASGATAVGAVPPSAMGAVPPGAVGAVPSAAATTAAPGGAGAVAPSAVGAAHPGAVGPVPPGPVGAAPAPAGFGQSGLPTSPYSSPFAPRGPWGPAGTAPLPLPPPPPPLPPLPLPPRQRRERSILGRLTLSAVLVVLGAVALADVLAAEVPASAYLAAPLAVTGLGLLVGTWVGRSRALVVLGVLLALGLGITASAERAVELGAGREARWTPTDAAGIAPEYTLPAGDAELDLRGVDFTGRDVATAVGVGTGSVRVLLPPAVDVRVTSELGVGDLVLFEERDSGVGLDTVRTDDGEDGPGGGSLRLRVSVGAGDVEVDREEA